MQNLDHPLPRAPFQGRSHTGAVVVRSADASAVLGDVADKMDGLVSGCAQNVPTEAESSGKNAL
jgi:hypothetical protein